MYILFPTSSRLELEWLQVMHACTDMSWLLGHAQINANPCVHQRSGPSIMASVAHSAMYLHSKIMNLKLFSCMDADEKCMCMCMGSEHAWSWMHCLACMDAKVSFSTAEADLNIVWWKLCVELSTLEVAGHPPASNMTCKHQSMEHARISPWNMHVLNILGEQSGPCTSVGAAGSIFLASQLTSNKLMVWPQGPHSSTHDRKLSFLLLPLSLHALALLS